MVRALGSPRKGTGSILGKYALLSTVKRVTGKI